MLAATIILLVICTFLPAFPSYLVAKVPSTIIMTFVNPFMDLIKMVPGTDAAGPPALAIDQHETVIDLQRQVKIEDTYNQALLIRLKELQEELTAYRQFDELAADSGFNIARGKLLRPRVTRSYRQQLTLNKGTTSGIEEGLVAVDSEILVGHVTQAKATSATVELITMPGKRLNVRIVPPPRQRAQRGEMLTRLQLVAQDDGKSFAAQCKINDPIAAGDVAVLDDPTWPREANGFYVGVVTELKPDPNDPHSFLIVRVEPIRSLPHRDYVVIQRQHD